MPLSQPGSRAEQAAASAVARKMSVSDALAKLSIGEAHATFAYEPTDEHFDRAKQVLRTKIAPVMADAF